MFSAGALPRTPLGELTALVSPRLPRLPSWFKGDLLLREGKGGGRRGEGKGRTEEGKEREGEGTAPHFANPWIRP